MRFIHFSTNEGMDIEKKKSVSHRYILVFLGVLVSRKPKETLSGAEEIERVKEIYKQLSDTLNRRNSFKVSVKKGPPGQRLGLFDAYFYKKKPIDSF